MSWWTNARDAFEGVATGGIAGLFNESLANKMGGLVNTITGRMSAEEKRAQQYAINDQIKAYKDQTALNAQQLAETRAEKDVEKRKINEKQIRALRNNYRPSGGFLNNNQNGGGTGTLGSSSNLTNKLGT